MKRHVLYSLFLLYCVVTGFWCLYFMDEGFLGIVASYAIVMYYYAWKEQPKVKVWTITCVWTPDETEKILKNCANWWINTKSVEAKEQH